MVRSYTFLPLFREPFGAQAAKDLQRGLRPTPSAPVAVLTPPVRGLAFFTVSGPEEADLNAWWGREVPVGSRPVVLVLHEDGLPEQLAGTDADYWIGAPAAASPAYAGADNIHLIESDDPEVVTEFAMQSMLSDPALFKTDQGWKGWHLQTPPPASAQQPEDLTMRGPRFETEPPADEMAAVLGEETSRPDASGQLEIDQGALDKVLGEIKTAKTESPEMPFFKRPATPGPPLPAGAEVGSGDDFTAQTMRAPERRGGPTRRATSRPEAPELQTEATMEQTAIIDPFSLLANAPGTGYMPEPIKAPAKVAFTPASPEAPREEKGKRSGGGLLSVVTGAFKSGKGKLVDVPAATGRTVTDLKPLVIAVASRKGGVGKTASAGAIAILLAEAVDQFGGWQAALVDANIVNPDSWGLHDLPVEAPTLRQVIAAIMRGAVPPDPVYAKIPAPLAIYPEDRNVGAGYDSGQVTRLVEYLKGRFAAIVFDLPNTMPDLESPAGRMASSIIAMADVVILPLTADRGAFQGVFDYLDAPIMKHRPSVVPYIVPTDKKTRDHPTVQEYLKRVDRAATKRVDITDDEGASRALWTGEAITTTSPQLRSDYINLVNALVGVARAGRM